jgi:prefoldin subunit 5
MLAQPVNLFPDALAQPQWFPDGSPSQAVQQLKEQADRLVAEYSALQQKNRDFEAAIDKQEKEKLLLSHPEFFQTEWEKLCLAAQAYRQALEELEQRSERTLQAIGRL